MGGKKAGTGGRVTRTDIERISHIVLEWLNAPIIVCGSYRRGKPDSGDIDIIVPGTWDDYRDLLIERFGEHKNGNPKRTGEIEGVQVDLMFFTEEGFGATLMASTGSGEFNRAMRSVARDNGYKLNEKGLWKRDSEIRIPGTQTEEGIFKALGMEYIPPEKRNGFGEVNKSKSDFQEARHAKT